MENRITYNFFACCISFWGILNMIFYSLQMIIWDIDISFFIYTETLVISCIVKSFENSYIMHFSKNSIKKLKWALTNNLFFSRNIYSIFNCQKKGEDNDLSLLGKVMIFEKNSEFFFHVFIIILYNKNWYSSQSSMISGKMVDMKKWIMYMTYIWYKMLKKMMTYIIYDEII